MAGYERRLLAWFERRLTAALLRLVSAILIELSEEWETGKRYVTFDPK